ncbi:hypothetical protein GCM10023195_29910 [Actinoallomurus liliacearum]|uniref:Uncharacterized protein n=1 Tax=Actinoallomurus liliacearum TaxID=1080073 RepID=A0ABP8TJ40_9ACTN
MLTVVRCHGQGRIRQRIGTRVFAGCRMLGPTPVAATMHARLDPGRQVQSAGPACADRTDQGRPIARRRHQHRASPLQVEPQGGEYDRGLGYGLTAALEY